MYPMLAAAALLAVVFLMCTHPNAWPFLASKYRVMLRSLHPRSIFETRRAGLA